MRHAFRSTLFMSLLCLACLLFSSGLGLAAQTNSSVETADLRVYGNVTAIFGPERAEFRCESAAKADWLLGKLLADLFWDSGTPHTQKTIQVSNRDIVLHSMPPYGMAVAGRSGSRVIVLGGSTEAEVVAAVTREPLLTRPDAQFAAQKPYPITLDFFDNRAFRSYIATPMYSSGGFGIASHWPFLKKFGMNALSFQQPSPNFFNPAPGVVDWAAPDYEVHEAERQGGMIIPSFGAGGVSALWYYNRFPGSRSQPSPTTLMGSWGRVGGAGDHFESWFTPEAQREAGDYDFERKVMNRYGSSPAVGGWQVYAGEPGAEMGNHGLSTEFLDYSTAGQAGFRDWLQAVRGFTLSSLGKRWFADPKHYTSWNDVTLPDVNSFFGNLDSASLLLNHHWERRLAAENEIEAPTGVAGWTPVVAPPSQQQAFLPWQPAWYRCVFNVSEWLGRAPGNVYLIMNTNNRTQAGISVFLNGHYLGVFKPESGSIGLKVRPLLLNGLNQLVLKLPGDGKLVGPVFLSRTEPHYFPYLGRETNARFADFKDWQTYGIYHYHQGVFERARRLDPDRPILEATDDVGVLGGYASQLASDYGMGIENTGREAFYFPWWPGLGIVNGFYATSEPSGVPVGSSLDRMMGWMLFDGDSAHQLFWDIENFIQREKDDGWFTRNTRLIQLFGKSLREQPKIALLWSVRTNLLGNPLPWSWDIGRGEIEAAHYDNVYVTEREMELGLAQSYPVVFDCGTALMDPPLQEAIRKYVEAGGTYVALHNTGRYTTLEPDSYPIANLTGFKVLDAKKRGKITFGTGLPLFHAWEGKQFEGEGTSLDWKNNETAHRVGTALAPAAADTAALARWEDGSVAVGYRKLGKGRVIILGSTFWRSGKDVAGVWLSGSEVERNFLQTLFTNLGVERNADSDSPDIWTRKYITKNGLQDWLIAYGNGDVARTATLAMRVESRPETVVDMLTNQPVPFTYTEDGWVHIPNITVPVVQTRIFGVRRAGLVSGLGVWWGEKTKYWKHINLPPDGSHSASVSGQTNTTGAGQSPDAIPFDSWKFLADRDGAISATDGWKTLGFSDAAWGKLERGPWNLQEAALKDYHGVGLYRRTFTVPASWAGHRIRLGFYSFNNPIVYDKGEFFVNGRPVTTYTSHGGNQTYGYDIAGLLTPGRNVLAIKVTGGKEFSGLSGPVWLEPERILSPSMDLNNGWQVIGTDGLVKTTVAAGSDGMGRNVVQRVTIPEDWAGRDVYLREESPDEWMSAIAVNGHPIVYNSYTHGFGIRTDVNISLYLRVGTPNVIEMWPSGSLPHGDGAVDPHDHRIRFDAVSIGCEKGKTNSLFGSMIHPDDPVEPDAPVPFTLPAADKPAPAVNVIRNGGIEDWAGGALPTGWETSNFTQDPKNPKAGGISKDTTAAHGGATSVRVENGLMTDNNEVSQRITVEPNSSYRVRGWYRGENIVSNGNGVLVWTSPGPSKDFYSHVQFTAQAPKTRTGTFDWQPFEFTIDTPPGADLLVLDLQLRFATGTVWFDDVEVVKERTVTEVESY